MVDGIKKKNAKTKEVFGREGFELYSTYRIPLTLLVLVLAWVELSGQSIDKNAADEIAKEMVSKIQTEIDPEFIYTYEGSKFVPPDGKTLLIMGQTVESITEYMDHFPNQPIPGGWSAYWGIPDFNGITESHKNESGSSQNHQMLVDNFPNAVIQSALWMVGKWNIAKFTGDGEYDRVVKKYSAWAKSVNRPIYLRIGYEFDGPHNELEPGEYVRAYKRIVDLIRKKGVDNIAFVWHSYASKPFKDYKLSAWYPGDEYVDWVAISVFGHAYNGTDFGPYCDDVLQFAKQHKKPVMIAEANPIHGIDSKSVEVWDQWFVNFFTFTYRNNIKAISFINEDWTQTRIPGISEWKDSRLYNNEQVSRAWFEETNKARYLKQSTELFKQLGFMKN
ncbi:glycoside hydrolase family 26 protein [Flagellimonas sp.]|uniref:glycoside hydrolase family 26 protein n=1 Tax=Flagellimonas sp. TaxID=2058762 RepID=UPI003F4A66E8